MQPPLEAAALPSSLGFSHHADPAFYTDAARDERSTTPLQSGAASVVPRATPHRRGLLVTPQELQAVLSDERQCVPLRDFSMRVSPALSGEAGRTPGSDEPLLRGRLAARAETAVTGGSEASSLGMWGRYALVRGAEEMASRPTSLPSMPDSSQQSLKASNHTNIGILYGRGTTATNLAPPMTRYSTSSLPSSIGATHLEGSGCITDWEPYCASEYTAPLSSVESSVIPAGALASGGLAPPADTKKHLAAPPSATTGSFATTRVMQNSLCLKRHSPQSHWITEVPETAAASSSPTMTLSLTPLDGDAAHSTATSHRREKHRPPSLFVASPAAATAPITECVTRPVLGPPMTGRIVERSPTGIGTVASHPCTSQERQWSSSPPNLKAHASAGTPHPSQAPFDRLSPSTLITLVSPTDKVDASGDIEDSCTKCSAGEHHMDSTDSLSRLASAAQPTVSSTMFLSVPSPSLYLTPLNGGIHVPQEQNRGPVHRSDKGLGSEGAAATLLDGDGGKHTPTTSSASAPTAIAAAVVEAQSGAEDIAGASSLTSCQSTSAVGDRASMSSPHGGVVEDRQSSKAAAVASSSTGYEGGYPQGGAEDCMSSSDAPKGDPIVTMAAKTVAAPPLRRRAPPPSLFRLRSPVGPAQFSSVSIAGASNASGEMLSPASVMPRFVTSRTNTGVLGSTSISMSATPSCYPRHTALSDTHGFSASDTIAPAEAGGGGGGGGGGPLSSTSPGLSAGMRLEGPNQNFNSMGFSGHASRSSATGGNSSLLVRLSHDRCTLVAGMFRVSRGGCLTVRNMLLLNPTRIDAGQVTSPSAGGGAGAAQGGHSSFTGGSTAAGLSPFMGARPMQLLHPQLPTLNYSPISSNGGPMSRTPLLGAGGVDLCGGGIGGQGPMTPSTAVPERYSPHVYYGGGGSGTHPSRHANPNGCGGGVNTNTNASFTLFSTSMDTPFSPITYSMDGQRFPTAGSPAGLLHRDKGNAATPQTAPPPPLLRAAHEDTSAPHFLGSGGGGGGHPLRHEHHSALQHPLLAGNPHGVELALTPHRTSGFGAAGLSNANESSTGGTQPHPHLYMAETPTSAVQARPGGWGGGGTLYRAPLRRHTAATTMNAITATTNWQPGNPGPLASTSPPSFALPGNAGGAAGTEVVGGTGGQGAYVGVAAAAASTASSLLLPYADIPTWRGGGSASAAVGGGLISSPAARGAQSGAFRPITGLGFSGGIATACQGGAATLPNASTTSLPPNVVLLRDLEVLATSVGEGASATVYVAIHKPTGRRLAIKRLDLSPLCLGSTSPYLRMGAAANGRLLQLQHNVVRELQVLHLTYRSPFMVKVYNAFFLPEEAALDIAMEFMHYGSLDHLADCLQKHARSARESQLSRCRLSVGEDNDDSGGSGVCSHEGRGDGLARTLAITQEDSVMKSLLQPQGHRLPRTALSAVAKYRTSENSARGNSEDDFFRDSLSARSDCGTDDFESEDSSSTPVEETHGVAERLVAVVGEQLLCGVRDMHLRGYIHRDIKPGNVLVNEHGVVKLSDFGLSRRCSEGGTGVESPSLTYVAPVSAAPTRNTTPLASPSVGALQLSVGRLRRAAFTNFAARQGGMGTSSHFGESVTSAPPTEGTSVLADPFALSSSIANSQRAQRDGMDVVNAVSTSSDDVEDWTGCPTGAKCGDGGGGPPSLDSSTSSSQSMADCSGTQRYMSPERQRGEPHGKPADIWAVGVTLAKFAVGEYPYDMSNIIDEFDRVARTNQPVNVLRFNSTRATPLSPVFADFCQLATLPTASQRPTAQELLEHPFFKQWRQPFNLQTYLAARVPVPSNQLKNDYLERRRREEAAAVVSASASPPG